MSGMLERNQIVSQWVADWRNVVAKLCHLSGVVVFIICTTNGLADEPLRLTVDPQRTTKVSYEIQISGEIITPSADGPRRFPLKSTGQFKFHNQPHPTDLGGPFTLRARRQFESASTETTVGKDHVTKVSLRPTYRDILVFGSENGLQQVSATYPLPRKQLDLIQMPFDVLAISAVLPTASVKVGDKWNTDAWLVPTLTGIEAVVEQSSSCELKTLTDKTAEIAINGSIEGAVLGSVSDISFSGALTFDRATQLISALSVTQKEVRSPGPVSPGLDVTAKIDWKQSVPVDGTDKVEFDDTSLESRPTDKQKLLWLQTPLRLQFAHSREWHLFHETPNVLMMRQLRNGNLISQCNISSAITVPPKQHTPDEEFLADVNSAVKERKGSVLKEDTVRDDGHWRIRHVQAVGDAGGEVIIWDYYLCSAATGEQFSLVFSHSRKDDAEFRGVTAGILSSLQVARRRTSLPFR